MNNEDTQGRNANRPVRIAGVITLLICASLTVYFLATDSHNPADKQPGTAQTATIINEPETELEKIANQLIEDNHAQWDDVTIKKFTKLWNNLAKPIRLGLVETAWYKHFSYVLETKLDEINKYESIHSRSNSANDSILTLAFTLDIIGSDRYLRNAHNQTRKFQNLLAKVQSEISKADAVQKPSSGDLASDAQLNAALRQEFELTPSSSHTLNQTPVDNASITPPIATANQTPAISGDNIRTLLTEYKSAYSDGDFTRLQTLFVTDSDSIDSTLNRDILDNYSSIFQASINRSVDFQNISWQYSKETAVGSGHYNANLTLPENRGTQSISADIVLTLEPVDGKLRIATLKLSNKNITTSDPDARILFEPVIEESPFLATDELQSTPPATVPNLPTQSELEDIVSRFIDAYEIGNITLLESLLSADVKTNDKSGFKAIKQEYIDLFASSSRRAMLIDDMRWQYIKNYAKGIGRLTATVRTKTGKSENHVSGKIQIVAKRIDDKIKITHIYHIARAE